MELRKDSLVTAATVIELIQQWALLKNDGTVATVGSIPTDPDIINAIPGSTTFTLDVRHPTGNGFDSCMNEIKELINTKVNKNSLSCTINEIKAHPPISFSTRLINLIEDVSGKQSIANQRITSGAGHDAMYMNNITDAAMLFVPSIDGKSHCEEDYTPWEYIEEGLLVLHDTVVRLSNNVHYDKSYNEYERL